MTIWYGLPARSCEEKDVALILKETLKKKKKTMHKGTRCSMKSDVGCFIVRKV